MVSRSHSEDVWTDSYVLGWPVCGPHALGDAVRSTLASDVAGPMSVLRGGPPVTLHVEKFEMAVRNFNS